MSDQFTPTPVKGLKTNNSSAPTNDNAAVLPAVATASTPAYVEGNEVKNSTDLHGSQRVTLLDPDGTATGTDANPLVITVDETPAGTNILEYQESPVGPGIAAGATHEFDSSSITDSALAYLNQITVSSTVRLKVEIGSYDGTTFTPFSTVMVNDTHTGVWGPKVPSTTAITGNATGDIKFRVRATNLDNLNAATIYATIEYSEK